MWKWLLGIGVIFVLGMAAAGFFLARSPALGELAKRFNPDQQAVAVRLSRAERGVLVRTVNAPGSIEPKTKVQLSAQVVARIIDLPFREGQGVKKGDVVVRLDAREFRSALESAQAGLSAEQARQAGAESALVLAEAELVRQRTLAQSGDLPPAQLERGEAEARRARSALDAARHAVEIARANIDRARKDLENTEIVAPLDGVIVDLNAEVGELVVVGTLNNASSVIMEIADLSVMLMKARVDEANIAPIAAGQEAEVFINAFRGRSFRGAVDRVGLKRQVDRDGTGYYEVEILVDKPEGVALYSGLTSNVDIRVQTLEGVLKVPSQAIVDRKLDDLPPAVVNAGVGIDRGKAFARVVFVSEGGVARPRAVRLGTSDLTHTIIEEGLTGEEQVIVGPFRALADLRDGRLVRDETEAAPSPETPQPPPGAPAPAAGQPATSHGGRGAEKTGA